MVAAAVLWIAVRTTLLKETEPPAPCWRASSAARHWVVSIISTALVRLPVCAGLPCRSEEMLACI